VKEMQKSEVARLLNQIREEFESAQRGLSGLRQGGCQHRTMNAKTERIANLHKAY
jgi:hypothetical protein